MTCRFLLYGNGIATAFFFVLFFGIYRFHAVNCARCLVLQRGNSNCRGEGGDRFSNVHSAGIQSCMCRDVVIEKKKREIQRSTRRWEENNLWIIRPRELSVLLGSSPIFGRHCKRKKMDSIVFVPRSRRPLTWFKLLFFFYLFFVLRNQQQLNRLSD